MYISYIFFNYLNPSTRFPLESFYDYILNTKKECLKLKSSNQRSIIDTSKEIYLLRIKYILF